MIRSILLPICTVSLMALSTMMVAQAAATPLEDDLTACMAIEADQARLTCFETVAQGIARPQAEETQPPVVKQRRLFGLNRSSRPVRREKDFGAPIPEETGITTISAKILEVNINFKTVNRIELDNGQVWQQLSSDSSRVKKFRSDTTYTATIKKAAFGSFRMTIEPMGRTIRVKRLK